LTDAQVPYEKLVQLRDKIGISEEDLELLGSLAETFVARKHEFADYFYQVFHGIPEARMILENEREPGFLKKAWAEWFESFFRARADRKFLTYLWNIGARHVEVNLDHRFTNLGFSVIRQYCHKVILDSAEQVKDGMLLFVFDKFLDLCLLVETDAFIEKTTRCDMQVFQGVEDRVRNPAMVIGGNIKRLQKQVAEDTREYRVYETLMAENRRLERMVTDIKTYMEFFSEELHIATVRLEEVIWESVKRLRQEGPFKKTVVETEFEPDASAVTGDSKELEYLFYCLIRNGMEAVDPANPLVRISSYREPVPPFNVEIEIFNRGVAPAPEEIEALFSPFYSTKTAGTGFGLPMAKLIVRKHYGKIRMEPIPGEGTKVIVSLPRSDGD